MINFKELRIGNLVNFLNYDIDPEGNKVGESEIETVDIEKLKHIAEFPDSYEGIPLTAEILEKCGFVKAADYFPGEFEEMWENEGGWYIDKEKGKYKFWLSNRYGDFLIIKYLHQLQNLFFALTGEELIINL